MLNYFTPQAFVETCDPFEMVEEMEWAKAWIEEILKPVPELESPA